MKQVCKKCMSQYEGLTCPLCASIEKETKKAEENGEKFPPRRVISEKERKSQRNMLVFLCILGALFILFILYRNGNIGSRAYLEPIERYFTAICDRDFDTYVSVMTPEVALDTIEERETLGYEKEQYIELLFADYFDEFGADMTVTFEWGTITVPDEELIDAFIRSYVDIYGAEPNAAAFKQVSALATFSGSTSTATIELECFLMRDTLTWYMVGCDYTPAEVAE